MKNDLTPLATIEKAIQLFPDFSDKTNLKIYDPAAGDGRLLEAMRKLYPNFQYYFSEILPERYDICVSKGFVPLSYDMNEVFDSSEHRGSMDVIFTNFPFLEDEMDVILFSDAWHWTKSGGWMGVFLNPESTQPESFFYKWIKTLQRTANQSTPNEIDFAPACETKSGDCPKPLKFVTLHKK